MDKHTFKRIIIHSLGGRCRMITALQTIRDIIFILNHCDELPTEPRRSSTPDRECPNSASAKLPFGLDQLVDDLHNGPLGLRTRGGVNLWLQETVSWAITSNYGSAPNYDHPGSWLLTVLQSPYPWETWEEWPEFAQEIRDARNTIARLTGYASEPAGLCPSCGTQTWAKMTDQGMADTAWCHKCATEWDRDHLTLARIWELRHTTDDVWVTGKIAMEIWKPHLDHDTLRDWVRHGRIDSRTEEGHPREYPLSQINPACQRLVEIRRRMSA